MSKARYDEGNGNRRPFGFGDEGRTPPTVGSQLLDIINKTATVPIRIEKTETKDGNVRWQPLGYKP